MLTNPIPGSPAAVLASVLRADPNNPPQSGDRHRATFSATNFPGLPSLMNEVVWVPQYALLDCNAEVTGMITSLGWATKGVTSVSAAYTPTPNDALILVNAAGGPVTITLPDATQPGFSPGQRYTIKKTDSSVNAVTVAASAGQLIDGAATQTLTATNGYTSVVFDGVNTNNWWTWATSGGGFSPTGPAGGALAGTYPNPSLSNPVTASGSVTAYGGLLTVTNTLSNPASSPAGFTAATAGDKLLGLQVTGDSSARFRVDSNGKVQWSPGNALPDTNLYRSAASTLTTDNNLTVGGTASVTGAATINGALPAVSTAPTGATAETFPRIVATAGAGSLTSGTLYLTAIQMPKGAVVNNITYCTKGTALAGLSHGWYLLADSGLVVRAVTADQTTGSWLSATNTVYTLPVAASYTTTYAGLYYVGIMMNATTPAVITASGVPPAGIASLAPVLCGTSNTGATTPPATGTTLTALTANSNMTFYSYTS